MGIAPRRVNVSQIKHRTGNLIRVSRYGVVVFRVPLRVNADRVRGHVFKGLRRWLIRSVRDFARLIFFLFRDHRSRASIVILQVSFRRALVVRANAFVVPSRRVGVHPRRRHLHVLLVCVRRLTVIRVDLILRALFRVGNDAVRRGECNGQDGIRYVDVQLSDVVVASRLTLCRTRVKRRRDVVNILQLRFRDLFRRIFDLCRAIFSSALRDLFEGFLVNLNEGKGERRTKGGGGRRLPPRPFSFSGKGRSDFSVRG